MDIRKVFVMGAGTMGNGIAQVCAQSGMSVIMCDIAEDVLARARQTIARSVAKLAEKGKISDSPDAVMSRIEGTTAMEGAGGCDMVIEAVFEKIEAKHDVFRKLNAIVGEKTILATNTSAIPITQIAAVVKHAENFLGLHFFNPVPLMMAVEVISGVGTSEETFRRGAEFVRYIGKEPILVTRDIAGFVLNRINMLSNMEAYRLVEQGVATPADIDKGIRLAFGRNMGPFETSDLVGLDVQLMAYTNVYEEEKDPRFYPPSILRRKVLAGHLGKKTGRGWYEYNPDGTRKEG